MARCWKREGLYADSQDELTRLADDWQIAIPYTAIAAQLLVSPRFAVRIVADTVENYALSPQASQVIRAGFDRKQLSAAAATLSIDPASSVTR